MIQLQLELD